MITVHRVIVLLTLQAVSLQWSCTPALDTTTSLKAQRNSKSQVNNKSTEIRELINAAASGDTKKVLQMLDKGLDVNATSERDDSEFSGMTVLMVASSRGYTDMIEALIKRGASVNLGHYSGETALMFAAYSGSTEAVKALLAAGANPNAKELSPHAGEFTPLTRAIHSDNRNRLEVAKTLIAAGAEVNFRGSFMISPLMAALDDLDMVKLLIANGADVNQRNFRGATALMGAASGSTVQPAVLI